MPLAPASSLSARRDRLRQALERERLDALIVTHIPNIFYLTNFGGSAAILIVGRSTMSLVTDSRYVAQVEASLSAVGAVFDLVKVARTYEQTLAELLTASAWCRVGFEGDRLSFNRVRWLEQTLDARLSLIPTERLIEKQRACKDGYELDILRSAARMITQVVPDVISSVRTGVTERQLAIEIELTIRRAGFERPAFEAIVASGPNAGFPHARPGDRLLQVGDLVVLDFGGVYSRYCVDLSRTVSLGPPGREAHRVYQAVRRAQAAAIAVIAPGVQASAIDRAARDSLVADGLGDAFGHSTGHGLGIELHEDPRIGQHSDEPIAAGMVFTIEPGAYIPGWGGVRLEDDVLVTDGGADVLTHGAGELIVV